MVWRHGAQGSAIKLAPVCAGTAVAAYTTICIVLLDMYITHGHTRGVRIILYFFGNKQLFADNECKKHRH